MKIEKPDYCNVAVPLIQNPPWFEDDSITALRFRTGLYIAACGQVMVGRHRSWKESKEAGKAYFRTKAKSVAFVLQFAELCRWCRVKPKTMRRQIERLKVPMVDYLPPLVRSATIYQNAIYPHDSIALSLNVPWCHVSSYYVRVGPLHQMPAKDDDDAYEFLQACARRSMSKQQATTESYP